MGSHTHPAELTTNEDAAAHLYITRKEFRHADVTSFSPRGNYSSLEHMKARRVYGGSEAGLKTTAGGGAGRATGQTDRERGAEPP